MIAAEVLIVLLGISITLAILLLRKPKMPEPIIEQSTKQAEDELDALELGNSYIDFLEKAMQRNSTKTKQQEAIENEPSDSDEPEEAADESDEAKSPAPDEAQSNLLLAREQFLLMEKAAAEKSEHEIYFWDSIYEGMTSLLEQFSTTDSNTVTTTSAAASPAAESKEKVFYIETQGKKIDGEVNKLKDIIYEQENALSSMKKALEGADDSDEVDNSELLNSLKEQLEALERQLSDSKMCMDVLEMENNRLQEEVDNIDSRHESLFEDNEKTEDNDSLIDLEQMKEVVEQQENKIQNLLDTIEGLEIDAAQAEKLKETLGDFARTSKEMMSCISILEEENDRLKSSSDEDTAEDSQDVESADSADTDNLKSTISQLEEELIKKDVAFAQLQDEFSSMETEYLSMYEAMHGDNS